jgi:GMP synthase-like glutamine amidotransferase
MKKTVLLINCYREKAEEKIESYQGWLKAGAAAAGLELDVRDVNERDVLPAAGEFSALVVSGSQKMVGSNEAEAGLLEFLERCRRPLLGICYGHQALARALGCLVKKDGQKHLGDEDVFLKKADPLFAGFPPVFKMRQSHEEIVVRDPALEGNFHVLAHNASGRVEAIVHRQQPLYGVQFHPEKSGELGVRLLANLLKKI